MKLFYNKHGSLTVYMSLIMAAIMIFTTVLIDAGRIVLARNIVSGAGDMALNAGLTYYNSVLQDTYGLFAVSKDMEDLQKNLEVYFNATLESNGLHDKGLVQELVSLALSGQNGSKISDIMGVRLADGGFAVTQASGANLSNVNVLRAQMLDYMKYRAPAVIGYGFLEKMNILKSLPEQQKALEEKKNYEKKLKEIQDLCLEIYKKSREYEDYLIGGGFKTPAEIKADIYDLGKKNFPYSTRDALAYVQTDRLKELKKDEYWGHNTGNPLGGDLKYSTDNFENEISGLRDVFYSASSSLSHNDIADTPDGKTTLDYYRFENYVNYYNMYKTDVVKFHTVNARYEYSKKDYEDRMERLEEEIDALRELEYENNSSEIDSLEDELDNLKDEWNTLETWYNNIFGGSSISSDVKEAVPENYGSTEAASLALGPNYNINNLREAYLKDLETDIKKLAIPQMRKAREYHQWFAELKTRAEDIKKDLIKLKSESQILKEIAKNWDVHIDNIAESGVKNDMQQDHDAKTTGVIEGYVDGMIEIFTNSINYSATVNANLEAFEYAGVKPAISQVNETDWTKSIIDHASNMTEGQSMTTVAELESKQNTLHTAGTYRVPEDNQLTFLNFERNIPERIKKVAEGLENTYSRVDSEFEYKDPRLRNFLGVECYDLSDKKYYADPLFAFLERNSAATKPEEDSEGKKKRDDMIKGVGIDDGSEGVNISTATIENVMAKDAAAAEIMSGDTQNNLQKSNKDNLADNYLETSKKAVSGFDRIGEILTGGRDKLYLMAYTTTMFSCYTTNREEDGNADEKTLSGIPFSEKNNEGYRAEQEYILLGSPNLKDNVDGVKMRLLGVRLLLNAIYAYTSDSRLRTETLSLATTIAGWTGFGVPIVQNILILAAALVESILDTSDLMAGKTVPLYKNPKVWRARYSGIDTLVKESVGKTLYKNMNEFTDRTKGEFNHIIDDYVENMVETSTDNIITSIQTPIQEKILWCMAQVGDIGDGHRLKSAIKDAFNEMQKSMETEVLTGGLAAKAKLEAFKVINSQQSQEELVSCIMHITGVTSENVNAVSDDIKANIEDFFEKRRKDMTDKINSVLDKSQLQTKLKTSVNAAMDSANKNAQEAINNVINDFGKEFEGAGGGALTIGEGQGKLELNGFDKTKASTFDMSYKDYLMVFLAIQYLIDEKSTVCRIGNLIQANAKKEGSLYYAGEDFTMQNASVLLQVEATAEIKPVFMQRASFNNNNEKFTVDSVHPYYNIKYKGVLGY